MKKWLNTTNNHSTGIALLVLRFGLSYPMIFLHGIPKFKSLLSESPEFPDPLGLGVLLSLALATFAELFCSILISIGLFTRFGAILLIINMMVATWIINGGKDFIFQEKSFVYLVAYLVILVTGAGRYSLDFYMVNLKKR